MKLQRKMYLLLHSIREQNQFLSKLNFGRFSDTMKLVCVRLFQAEWTHGHLLTIKFVTNPVGDDDQG